MKRNTANVLCCPLCKRELALRVKKESNEDLMEGRLVCICCNREYPICDGIPVMYVPDNEIIALSNCSEFAEYVVTPEDLEKRIEHFKIPRSSTFLTNGSPMKRLQMFGWFFLFLSIASFVALHFIANGTVFGAVSLLLLCVFASTSVAFFAMDYMGYRARARTEYFASLRKLKELSDEQKLSEYDIRVSVKDGGKDLKRDPGTYKGKKIASILDDYGFDVNNVLNVGCGGTLHRSVSKPYFDRGYEMIGVDISKEYLRQFGHIFKAEAVLANGMALPFRSDSFDLVNLTDIVEHLHHPFLGLREAQRVLRGNGIIILTTNNRCVVSLACLNPLVFLEKLIGLYCSSVLPPRNILGQWMDMDFYHTEFSKAEISELIRAAGFETLGLETCFPTGTKLDRILRRIPALKFMCSEFVIVAKKRRSGHRGVS